ncbi:PLxRFG domain-containing protein [Pseudomonas sp.]|uniref:PLxRFG domain-containing protein n=1 Tax=Pseudomonas sp. TaxID=306 RepID=UPI00258AD1DC|nr:PLxRFG domain-containing protein [Pseudomonas sp.]
MGAGTNVQKRLVGLHHIDAPWRPSDLEQREGRIIRRGNDLYNRDPDGFEVFIGRYATEQTYDTRRWQILEHKARGIEQLRNFDGSINEIDDIEGEAANAADMKAAASGDPLILEETRLKNDVRRLEQLQAAHADDVVAMNRKAKSSEEYAKKTGPQLLAGVKSLNDQVKKHKLDKDGFAPITIDNQTFDTKESAQQEIAMAVSLVRTNKLGGVTIVYRGVPFEVKPVSSFIIVAKSPTGGIGSWASTEPFSTSGFVQRMKNYVDRLPAHMESIQASIDKSANDAVALREEAKKPFGQAADLQAAREAYKVVQRALLAKGPAVPESQKAAVAEGIEAQKARLETMGYGEQLREFFAGQDGPKFLRATRRSTGVPKADAAAVVKGIAARWDNAPGLVVVESMQDPAIPQAVRLADQRQRQGGAKGEPKGFWYDGSAYIVSGAHDNNTDVIRTLFHEVLGHRGLRGTFGKGLDPILSQIIQARRPDVAKKAKQYGLNMANPKEALEAAEEVLADMAQEKPELGFVKRTIAAIRTWLRKNVPALKDMMLTDDEITRSYILPARAFVEQGAQAGREMAELVAFNRVESVFDWSNPGGLGLKGSSIRTKKIGSTTIDYGVGNGTAEIISVRTPAVKRGAGSARAAMTEFLQEADARGLQVKLQASALDKKTSTAKLVAFYKSLGFELTGVKINAVGDPEMIRQPVQATGSPRFSREEADRLIDDASSALEESGPVAKADYIGRVVGDIGLGAKLIVHPRTVAAVHPEFTPVYRTAISQMETRDEIISELGRGVKPYDMLDQAGKESVNKALELGRLTSNVYSPEDLKKGVTNTGTRKVVVIGDDGKPKTATVQVISLLTQPGEIIKLTDDEIQAYQGLRATFDRALDLMRDQTLDELGFPELKGKPNAAKAIRDLITEDMPADQAEKLANIAKFVAEIEQAKRAGYVPFARYGDYVVTVKEKTVNLDYQDDGAGSLTITNAPDSMAEDLLGLGAEQVAGGWKVKASKKNEVERLTERTVYSAKVETGLKDFMASRKAKTVEDIPAVREAIEKARAEYVGDDPARRIVAFKAREKKADQPVRLSDVDALAEIASIDNETWDAVRDKLADAIKSKGFRKHFFHSDNVPGYTGDFERSIADYVIGIAGYLSRRQHMKRWDNSVTAITEKSKLFEYASKYRQYVNDPQEELAMIRQIGFFSYIAGVMASAFANLTQVPMLTVPTLSQVAPTALVMKEIGRAYKDALAMMGQPSRVGLDMFDPAKAPTDVRDVLMEAWDEGSFVPLETFDLMMTARQRNVGARKGVKAFNTATQVVSVAFTFAERLNRLVTFIAAARMADKPAVKANAARVLAGDALARQTTLGRNWNAKNFAEWVVDESQYRMGKANRPTMMRGVGSALMQFKGFMIQTFEAWYRMAALHGRDGQMAALASLASVVAIGGLWGLPGADDLRKLIEAAYKQITGMDLDMKTELRAWVAKTSGSNALSQMVTKGASYPLGVDLTRVGFGSVVPDSPLAAAGIPFDMLIGRPKRAFEKASTEDYMGAAAEFTPNFMKNMLVAGSWRLDGVRDKQGNLILTPDELRNTDIGMKAIGFQPSIVTDVRDYEYAQRRQETAVDGLKRSYTNKIAKLIGQMERTEDEAKLKELDARLGEVYDDIAEHNATAKPEEIIQISPRAIRNRVARELDGVKATWGRERKAARGAADEMRAVFDLEQDE